METDSQRARFQQLTLPHLDRLLALAMRWGEQEEAEDCVQETCIRAWMAFAQLRDPRAAFAWLCRILRTVAIERFRLRKRRRELLLIAPFAEGEEEQVADDAPSPLDAVLARVEQHRVREALRSIPEEFAEAVELHDVVGLKYREIAQVTSAPIGTVMSRISRGRRLLAAALIEAEKRSGMTVVGRAQGE